MGQIITYKKKLYELTTDSKVYGFAVLNEKDAKMAFIFHPSAIDLCPRDDNGFLYWESLPNLKRIALDWPEIHYNTIDIFGLKFMRLVEEG